MSISDFGGGVSDFEGWITDEFAARGAFTTLVILVEIGEAAVTPLSSTYLSVIGDDVGWLEILALFAGARVSWDGAAFFAVTAPEGGPLDNAIARTWLRDLERRVAEERLTLNEGQFFDRAGQRLMVEEVTAP